MADYIIDEKEREVLMKAFYLWHGLRENTTEDKMRIVNEVLGPSHIPWHEGDTDDYYLRIKEDVLLVKAGLYDCPPKLDLLHVKRKFGQKRHLPEPLYPCKYCYDEYSFPATDLWWSEIDQDWVCENCWYDRDHGHDEERGISLECELQMQKDED